MNADLAERLEERLADLGIDISQVRDEDILTTKQAAEKAGVLPSAITNWRERGYQARDGKHVHLPNIGTDDDPRYYLPHVAVAERDTRRPWLLRRNPDIAAFQMNEHWDRINPEAAA